MPVRSRIKDSIFSLTVKQNWTTRKSLWQVRHEQSPVLVPWIIWQQDFFLVELYSMHKDSILSIQILLSLCCAQENAVFGCIESIVV